MDYDEKYEDIDVEIRGLTNSDKLYLSACAVLAVGLLFMASIKLKY